MDAVFDLPWRHGPAIAMIVLGAALAGRGLRAMPNPIGPTVDLLAWLRGFRRAVIGLGLALAGLAWLCQLPWLLAIALGVGLQEARESTHYITTLQPVAPRRPPPTGSGAPTGEGPGARPRHEPGRRRPPPHGSPCQGGAALPYIATSDRTGLEDDDWGTGRRDATAWRSSGAEGWSSHGDGTAQPASRR